MKKRGFTLVEILAVLAVLGILVMIVLPQIGGSISSKKEKEYEKIKETIESAAKIYHTSNDDIYSINIDTLVSERYLTTDISNPITNDKMGGCIKVFLKDGIYEYEYLESCGTIVVPFSTQLSGGNSKSAI